MARHNDIGQWGEEKAREHLVSRGYAVMDSNLHVGHNELDIIAMKGDRIIFVEVKTRSTHFADPLDAIDEKKIRRIVRGADSYIRIHNIDHKPQFDVIVVVGTPGGEFTLEHYEDAFEPPLLGAM